jgi:hypothetical protein
MPYTAAGNWWLLKQPQVPLYTVMTLQKVVSAEWGWLLAPGASIYVALMRAEILLPLSYTGSARSHIPFFLPIIDMDEVSSATVRTRGLANNLQLLAAAAAVSASRVVLVSS